MDGVLGLYSRVSGAKGVVRHAATSNPALPNLPQIAAFCEDERTLTSDTRWAKLCMLIVGGLGLFATRTLYDEKTLQMIRGEEVDGTGCGVPSTGEGDVEQPGTPRSLEESAEAPLPSILEAVSPPIFPSQRDSGGDFAPGSPKGGPPAPRILRGRRCCCFDPPRFSCGRCSRALAATFSGLTLWVSPLHSVTPARDSVTLRYTSAWVRYIP